MTPDRTELTWKFTPVDFFEAAYETTDGEARIRLDGGVAVATIDGGVPERAVEKRLRGTVVRLLQVRALRSGRPFTLDETANPVEFRGPHRNIILRAGVGAISIASGNLDVVQTDAAGNVLVDTKAERIAADRSDLDDLLPKANRSAALARMLESFLTSLAHPEAEFVRLYEIRDALGAVYKSEGAGRNALSISKSDWTEFGRLANDAPVLEGRHSGKHSSDLRPATTEERAFMRRTAQDWIRRFAAML